LAYSVANRYHPDAAVSYYGSGIADALDEAATLRCPILFHFGDNDSFIPVEQAHAVRDTLGDREGVSIHIHNAGHAFDNHDAPMFYNEDAARDAWQLTTNFLAKALPL
jgi:carboxymethylenebutenolidase